MDANNDQILLMIIVLIVVYNIHTNKNNYQNFLIFCKMQNVSFYEIKFFLC